MEEKKILIVEDEENIARVVKLELEYEGYQTEVIYEGLEAWHKINTSPNEWQLILLDVMLPGLSGMEILRRIRKENMTIPVIMLTARDAIVDKVTGLDQGADDYVTKPFEIEELLARIRVLIRRHETMVPVEETLIASECLTLADLVMNLDSHEVTREETLIDLTPREFDLLAYLLKNVNRVLSREQILQHVWGFDYFGDTNVVDVYIRYLRQKVDRPFSVPLIKTVRGVGYVVKETGS
ncbi:response regulator transcription factor [Salipaludibacillus agaradhaerens]|uniref:response regulator transcription factor n=1 Tax=Salipaludibacillus agaradhaerens TaxID=76935 RepID=UPI002151F2E8|nr:response regulator transcription factor [Salipaludibacillus agaradhaerens]MCR6105254.1 response regulator transcription factor [Salipaludibacillus agaradhaerens]MCR6117296.1 response regulator transcription factor [Salipaludibacillus agaradhaerens]